MSREEVRIPTVIRKFVNPTRSPPLKGEGSGLTPLRPLLMTDYNLIGVDRHTINHE